MNETGKIATIITLGWVVTALVVTFYPQAHEWFVLVAMALQNIAIIGNFHLLMVRAKND